MLKDKPAAVAPAVLGLQALAHVAADDELGPRFLALTGLDAGGLRAGAADPAILAAVIEFLAAHERDLVACAAAIGVTPETLVAAGASLEAGA